MTCPNIRNDTHYNILLSFYRSPNLLLFAGRVKKVLYARDKWLKANGVILPDRANLFICGIADVEFKENFVDRWSYIYGYDMSSIVDDALSKGQITELHPDKVRLSKFRILDKNEDLRIELEEKFTNHFYPVFFPFYNLLLLYSML